MVTLLPGIGSTYRDLIHIYQTHWKRVNQDLSNPKIDHRIMIVNGNLWTTDQGFVKGILTLTMTDLYFELNDKLNQGLFMIDLNSISELTLTPFPSSLTSPNPPPRLVHIIYKDPNKGLKELWLDIHKATDEFHSTIQKLTT